jgi:two-component system LytT family response regulator
MKKVIIIDDEVLARGIVKEYLLQYKNLEVVAECSNGYEGVKAIHQFQPDLIVLDIQMPKISGFEMLELLDRMPGVIFATAFDEFAIKAFEANAIDYLLKPFTEQRFNQAIEKWMNKNENSTDQKEIVQLIEQTKLSEEKNRIVVKNNNDINIVSVNDIHYIEAYDDYVKIFTNQSYFLKKQTMNYYEQVLNHSLFFRTHRSYIINLQQLTRIEPLEKNTYLALLKSGKKIPLSRPAYIKLKEKLGI